MLLVLWLNSSLMISLHVFRCSEDVCATPHELHACTYYMWVMSLQSIRKIFVRSNNCISRNSFTFIVHLICLTWKTIYFGNIHDEADNSLSEIWIFSMSFFTTSMQLNLHLIRIYEINHKMSKETMNVYSNKTK